MKKFISVLLSVMMMISVGAISVMPVMAETINSEEPFTPIVITGQVNGNVSNDVSFEVSPADPMEYTFNYTGSDEFLGWAFDGLVEGVDYVVIDEDGTEITIKLTAAASGKDVIANALTKSAQPGKPAKPSKPDDSGKSPSTGAGLVGIAVAGAGVALLAASKKKD